MSKQQSVGELLQHHDDYHRDEAHQKVLPRAEVRGSGAAGEVVDAHGQQAQADGHDHQAGSPPGEQLLQGLDEEAQNDFQDSAGKGKKHSHRFSPMAVFLKFEPLSRTNSAAAAIVCPAASGLRELS